jgi:hypothetical protein
LSPSRPFEKQINFTQYFAHKKYEHTVHTDLAAILGVKKMTIMVRGPKHIFQ